MIKSERVPFKDREDDWAVLDSQRLADQVNEMVPSPSQKALALILRHFAEFQADDSRYSFYPADILDDIDDILNP